MATVYYIITFLTLLYVMQKHVNDAFTLLIVLSFYPGLASFAGVLLEGMYKILLMVLGVYLLYKYQPFKEISSKKIRILLVFVFFSLSFISSALLNDNNVNLTISQYSKYFVPFCIFFVFMYYLRYPDKFVKFQELLFTLVTIQVFLSLIKLFTFGVQEWVVGSISMTGGGIATPFPILVFMMLWLKKKHSLKLKDWLYILAVLFVSFMSLKRAIWFMMPVIVFLFMVYIPRKKIPSKILLLIPFIPVLFYLGVRLNPTLNKEDKIWGSFDIDFVIQYTNDYSFGKEKSVDRHERRLAEGRGGVTNMLFKKIIQPSTLTKQDFLGYGLDEIATKDYETFDQEKFNVHSKGSVTGVFKTYIISGVLGIITFTAYLLCIVSLIEERRVRLVVIGFLFWDYFYYSGIILPTFALSILLFYVILYSNLKAARVRIS